MIWIFLGMSFLPKQLMQQKKRKIYQNITKSHLEYFVNIWLIAEILWKVQYIETVHIKGKTSSMNGLKSSTLNWGGKGGGGAGVWTHSTPKTELVWCYTKITVQMDILNNFHGNIHKINQNLPNIHINAKPSISFISKRSKWREI